MDLRFHEVLFQFNRGMHQALESLDIVEKLEPGSADGVSGVGTNLNELLSCANNHFASKIAQKEQEEENNYYRVRQKREKADRGPNEIYFELKSREEVRREQGFPPQAVILPWTQVDDDRILVLQNAASSSLPTQPGQLPVTGDTGQENQEGGTPT